mmetsp:Transcript_19202/g.66153  ORF Transcript_19202/g.66153 Transcript_19202/m.66153 type:complete len:314 (-) Transcript_19202:2258-3199(-)
MLLRAKSRGGAPCAAGTRLERRESWEPHGHYAPKNWRVSVFDSSAESECAGCNASDFATMEKLSCRLPTLNASSAPLKHGWKRCGALAWAAPKCAEAWSRLRLRSSRTPRLFSASAWSASSETAMVKAWCASAASPTATPTWPTLYQMSAPSSWSCSARAKQPTWRTWASCGRVGSWWVVSFKASPKAASSRRSSKHRAAVVAPCPSPGIRVAFGSHRGLGRSAFGIACGPFCGPHGCSRKWPLREIRPASSGRRALAKRRALKTSRVRPKADKGAANVAEPHDAPNVQLASDGAQLAKLGRPTCGTRPREDA